ncbi:MAG: hypothetical protein QM426_09500 [Euryarchaeota archaeon]|nr:hypothetical protein [Euryarchaeota archaeon]
MNIIIILGIKVVLILVLRNRDETNQLIAIEGSNVTSITDAKEWCKFNFKPSVGRSTFNFS